MFPTRSRLWILCLTILLAVPLGRPTATLSASEGQSGMDPRVQRLLAESGAADVLVLFGPQPDLSTAYTFSNKALRGQWVMDTLRVAAERAQHPVLAELRRQGAPYRAFWVVNAIAARLTAEQIERVAGLPGVTAIVPDTPYRAVPEPNDERTLATSPDAIEWGVNRVNAPWAWEQGYTGQGVVVAGQDTGYDWDHPALISAYRGYDAATGTTSHNYNWHDAIHVNLGGGSGNACGFDATAPCDDYGHGTHTMGTMAGNDLDPAEAGWPAAATNAIGVAPGSRWIGCRNMEDGYGRPSTYIECFEWLIAPYPVGGAPDQGDPSKAPDIVNNSWGCPLSEGCTLKTEIEPALNAADAAGILVVASAGNNGSSCGSVVDPPAIYPAAFSVGATDSGDALAGFSSRGPVTYNGQTFIKPNISAPGVSVRSSVPGIAYSTMSGTSMAGPHVASVAALLISAEPALRGQTDMLKEILVRTADPRAYDTCGSAPGGVPNNGYGWGIVNAQRAIESLSQSGTLSGVVSDAGTGAPLSGAIVTLYAVDEGTMLDSQLTDTTGSYSFSCTWGNYRIEVTVSGYDPGLAEPLYVVGGQTTAQDFALAAIPAVADLSITRSGPDALLSWVGLSGNVAGYELWRDTSPYFALVTPPAEVIADGSTPACSTNDGIISCADGGAVGDPDVNHFYVVRSVGQGGGTSLISNQVGEYDFLLTPGGN